jgi:3-deoxy-7-phosphoheptulonate synthase
MQAEIPPRVLIDCAHGNSNKDHEKQIEVWNNVSKQIIEGNDHIMGMMIESFLEEGNQPLSNNKELIQPSISITDPCLSWACTKELVLSLHQRLSKEESCCSSIRL